MSPSCDIHRQSRPYHISNTCADVTVTDSRDTSIHLHSSLSLALSQTYTHMDGLQLNRSYIWIFFFSSRSARSDTWIWDSHFGAGSTANDPVIRVLWEKQCRKLRAGLWLGNTTEGLNPCGYLRNKIKWEMRGTNEPDSISFQTSINFQFCSNVLEDWKVFVDGIEGGVGLQRLWDYSVSKNIQIKLAR